MRHKWLIIILSVLIIFALGIGSLVLGGDLDDGISKFTDDSISANDKMGKADTNINFIVLESMAEAKKRQKQGDKNANFNDGSGDNNQNSVVCEVGAECKNIVNITVQNP